MGIDAPTAQVLVEARRGGVSFTQTLTVGRQTLYASGRQLARLGFNGMRMGEHGEKLLRLLGATSVDSLDASDYEGATLIHDLNRALPEEWDERYSTVFDGGSLEHVYDLPRALRSCMSLVCVGGHYIAASPANNQMGHGFYQLGPEFYLRSFAPERGWRLRGLFVTERFLRTRWYAVSDPKTMGRRLTLRSRASVDLFVVAQKLRPSSIADSPPQQSDYEAAWTSPDGSVPRMRTAKVPDALRPAVNRLAALRDSRRGRAGLTRIARPQVSGAEPVALLSRSGVT